MLTFSNKFKQLWLFVVDLFCCLKIKNFVNLFSLNFNKINKILILILLSSFVFNQIISITHQANHHNLSGLLSNNLELKSPQKNLLNGNFLNDNYWQASLNQKHFDQDFLNCLLCNFANLIKKFNWLNQNFILAQYLFLVLLFCNHLRFAQLNISFNQIRAPPQLSLSIN